MAGCIFCDMVSGKIPVELVYEDEDVIAFNDINPQAPVHVLVIPRTHIATLNELAPEHTELAGKLFTAAAQVAKIKNIADPGYRSVLNCNAAAGQTVYHLHLHVLGGRSMRWPPG